MTSTPKVLIVEDEIELAEVLRDNLLAEGYVVDVSHDGEEALTAACRHRYDLMVLDVMLPSRDGFSVCETVRRKGHPLPILFLTALGDAHDRIRGLEAGGDDYLTKPFHLSEFLLRVDALLRRRDGRAREPQARFGDNKLDLETGRAVGWDGRTHQIGRRERQVLELLMSRENETLGRDEILEEVWSDDVYPSTRRVDQIVGYLREVFERDPARPRHFHTISARRYRFTRLPEES